MNDLVRFANSVEYATGKKRGRHPVFNSNQFYPYKAERRLQSATVEEIERYIGVAYEAAITGEVFVSDTLEDLSNLPEGLSDNFKREISYAAESIAKKVSENVVNMSEMVIGKPYYPPETKSELLKNWEANFQTLCKSAESDAKKEISRIVKQAKDEGWNGKQLEKAIKGELPKKYKGRAELIARTESTKLNSEVTRETYKEIGVEYYVWMATMDERVRPEHANMNGQICSVANPDVIYEENPDDPLHPIEKPRGDDMVHLHPGEDFQCRCTMVAWDPEIDGKYEVKERPEPEESQEPTWESENDPQGRELEQARERVAEQENELKSVKNELESEKKARKAAENEKNEAVRAKKSAEKRLIEKTAENEALRAKNAEAEQRAGQAEKRAEMAEKRIKNESEKVVESAKAEIKEAGRYKGLTNDPQLNNAIAQTETAVKEMEKGGLISSLIEKINTLKEKIFGLKTEEEVMESLGVKRFPKKMTPLQVVDGANPSKDRKNCFACAAVYEMRCRGWNIESAAFDESMIVLSNEPQKLFRNAQKVKFSSKKELLESISSFENGSRFSVCGLLQDNKGGLFFHVFSVVVENGRATVVCSQNGIVGTDKFFKRFSLVGDGNFFFRVDDLKANYRNLSKVIRK